MSCILILFTLLFEINDNKSRVGIVPSMQFLCVRDALIRHVAVAVAGGASTRAANRPTTKL